jgi:hypothetical protein
MTLRSWPSRQADECPLPAGYAACVVVLVLVLSALSAGTGSALIVDGWRRARRPDLTERLMPFRPVSVAHEAEEWLDQNG